MNSVRIGNAQAFWGDRDDAAFEMLRQEPDLDYLTLDYLAEVSMSILALQRERDPSAGFARDFVEVVRSIAPYWSAGGRCRLIANAGGLNPRGCAEQCRQALAAAGCREMRIGVVTGDDILEVVRRASVAPHSREFANLETGAQVQTVSDRLVTANAYLGAAPIVEALRDGADIVITGRVADPSLAVAACMHHYGWAEDAFDRIAGATVAGHLIECGAQVTGGISTDWLNLPDPAHIGFPIVEVFDDGSCIVTKPRNTGGRVSALTVKEQLVYEIGDPENYLSPDVIVSFLSLVVEDFGNDRVRISGAIGTPRPNTYKVSATFRDGFRAAGTLTIVGRNAAAKAQRVGELVLQLVREAGFELRDSVIECLGSGGATNVAMLSEAADRFGETVLRIAIESDARHAVERFSRELMPFITAGPQGTTGYAEGRPRVHPVFRYWPSLVGRETVCPHVEILVSEASGCRLPTSATDKSWAANRKIDYGEPRCVEPSEPVRHKPRRASHLYDIAYARSGDKGTSVNIGVIARSSDAWEFLQTWLTADRVGRHFEALGIDSVKRFELPNLGALNFVLCGALRCGLRTDAQGKAFGQVLLEMPLPKDYMPASIADEII